PLGSVVYVSHVISGLTQRKLLGSTFATPMRLSSFQPIFKIPQRSFPLLWRLGGRVRMSCSVADACVKSRAGEFLPAKPSRRCCAVLPCLEDPYSVQAALSCWPVTWSSA